VETGAETSLSKTKRSHILDIELQDKQRFALAGCLLGYLGIDRGDFRYDLTNLIVGESNLECPHVQLVDAHIITLCVVYPVVDLKVTSRMT